MFSVGVLLDLWLPHESIRHHHGSGVGHSDGWAGDRVDLKREAAWVLLLALPLAMSPGPVSHLENDPEVISSFADSV